MKELKSETKAKASQTHTKARSDFQKSARYESQEMGYLTPEFQPPQRFTPLLAKLSHPANATLRVQFLTQLQQTYGNRYVQRMLQARAGVNKPWDRRKPETAMPMPETQVRNQAEEEEGEEEELLQAGGGGAGAGTTGIRGPREMWYFNGETPANYTVSQRLSTNRAGGTFSWSVSPQLTLSSPTDVTPTVTTATASNARNDAWIRVRHTDASGNFSAASYRVTVLAPDSLDHLRNVDNADPVWGYDCEIHYSILDQFGTTLPHNVPINEQWTSGIVADFPLMNWRRGPEGSATVNPADWYDHIQGELATHFPTPLSPGHLLAGIPIYHWTGDWRVGSLTIGDGTLVRSVTWQKNWGYARHT